MIGCVSSIRTFIERITGIRMEADRDYFLESRLTTLFSRHGIRSVDEFIQKATAPGGSALVRELTDSVVVGETSFFRDTSPFFLILDELIPSIIAQRKCFDGEKPAVSILSAGCSTGQETYSLAMMVRESPILMGSASVRIVGVDISERSVGVAREGRYSAVEVERGLSAERLRWHFEPADAGTHRVRREVRDLVDFRQANLLEPRLTFGEFDLVLCRNVLIYFSESNQTLLLDNLARLLRPGGKLVVGASDIIVGHTDKFVRRGAGAAVYYEKV